MNQIQTFDEFQPLYGVGGYDRLVPFRKSDVQAVDYLVKLSHGNRTAVTTLKDWEIVAKIFEFWTRRWPLEWEDFGKQLIDIKATRARKDGKSKSGEIKYVGALPPRFMKLIKVIFPEQQFDKRFVNQLVDKISIIKVGQKHDTWFVI